MERKKYKQERKARGEEIRTKANEPMLCPCCGSPTNSRNEAQEVYNAKNS
jgi:hypothetical protein